MRELSNIEIKTLVSVPAWVEQMGQESDKLTSSSSAYAKVPLIFRATRIRCNSLSRLPWHLYDAEDNPVDWPFDLPLRKLLWKSEAALLLRGAAYIQKLRNQARLLGLEWLNPLTMSVTWSENEKAFKFQQRIADKVLPGTNQFWTSKDIIYIPEFSLTDDIAPGDCAASVALGDAQLAHYLTRFASAYFEGGGMPVTLVSMVGLKDKAEKERIQNFFQRAITNVSKAFRVLAVGNEFKMETTQAPLGELATPELKEQARKDVALAFEIPVTLLDDDANYATAQEHKRGFYDETILPRAEMVAEELNAQLLKPMGFRIDPSAEEMDIYQADENDRATAFSQYVGAGMDKRVAVSVLGIEIPEDVRAIWDAQAAASDQARDRLANLPAPAADPFQPADQGQGADPNAEQKRIARDCKAIEAGQFRRFYRKHGSAKAEEFQFEFLDLAERAAIVAELVKSEESTSNSRGARPGETGVPFRSLSVKSDLEDRAKLEKKLQKAVEQAGAEALDLILKAIEKAKREGNGTIDASIWTAIEAELRKQLRPVLLSTFLEAAQQMINDQAGIGVDWALVNQRAADWADQYTFDLVSGIADNTRTALQDAIPKFFEQGLTIDQIAGEIEPYFGSVRAEMIAVTEVTRAAAEGERALVDELAKEGIQMVATWSTAEDELVCNVCGPRDGHKQGDGWTDPPPAHPRCRCWLNHEFAE